MEKGIPSAITPSGEVEVRSAIQRILDLEVRADGGGKRLRGGTLPPKRGIRGHQDIHRSGPIRP